jgi:hypothetical protein
MDVTDNLLNHQYHVAYVLIWLWTNHLVTLITQRSTTQEINKKINKYNTLAFNT